MSNASSARASTAREQQTRSLSQTGRQTAVSSKLGGLVEFARSLDLVRTVSLLTLVLTVIFGFDHWVFRIVSRICLLTFVLYPPSLRRPQLWLALALAGTITTILTWERVDNH